MPKFYVTCGSQSLVADAPTAGQAAMSLVDEMLAPHVWIYTDSGLSEATRREHLVLEALLHLGSEVRVSERGLGRSEAGVFGVPELIDLWHALMQGVGRLLSAAGLEAERALPAPMPKVAPQRSAK